MTTYSQKAAFEEGAALSLLRELGDPPCPMNAFLLARWCKLRVRTHARSFAVLAGDEVLISAKASPLRQQEQLAHELGHWTLLYYDVPDSEWGATWVGDALMLPRAALLRDLAELAGDLAAVRARHPHCSERMLARRLQALEWQGGRAA